MTKPARRAGVIDIELGRDEDGTTWCPADGEMTDGPAELWFAVFADDGAFMGATRTARQPSWLWRDGRLCCDYSPLRVTVRYGGRFQTGLICAISPQTRTWRPLWPVSLGPPERLRPGDFITVADGVIALIPELPGPHG
jgi:hypothetical protein